MTNPRKRLAAEVAWLPGIGPKLVKELLAILESCPANLLAEDKLLPTARANVLAAAFARCRNIVVRTLSHGFSHLLNPLKILILKSWLCL